MSFWCNRHECNVTVMKLRHKAFDRHLVHCSVLHQAHHWDIQKPKCTHISRTTEYKIIIMHMHLNGMFPSEKSGKWPTCVWQDLIRIHTPVCLWGVLMVRSAGHLENDLKDKLAPQWHLPVASSRRRVAPVPVELPQRNLFFGFRLSMVLGVESWRRAVNGCCWDGWGMLEEAPSPCLKANPVRALWCMAGKEPTGRPVGCH